MLEFLDVVNNANICGQGGTDGFGVWIHQINSLAKSSYIGLHNMRIGSHEVDEFSFLWQVKIPQKVSFFIWKVLHDSLPTKENLAHPTSR